MTMTMTMMVMSGREPTSTCSGPRGSWLTLGSPELALGHPRSAHAGVRWPACVLQPAAARLSWEGSRWASSRTLVFSLI